MKSGSQISLIGFLSACHTYLSLFVCQQTNIKDIAGQPATLTHLCQIHRGHPEDPKTKTKSTNCPTITCANSERMYFIRETTEREPCRVAHRFRKDAEWHIDPERISAKRHMDQESPKSTSFTTISHHTYFGHTHAHKQNSLKKFPHDILLCDMGFGLKKQI